MAIIDVGPGAIDGDTAGISIDDYTFITTGNPANQTGSLDTFEIWLNLKNGAGVKIGTFYGSGTSWTSRDYETIGSVTAGSKQTFSGLDCDVKTDDVLGAIFTSGKYEANDGGSNLYFVSGDKFGGGTTTYTYYGIFDLSLYATGTSPDYIVGVSSSTSLSAVGNLISVGIAPIENAAVISALQNLNAIGITSIAQPVTLSALQSSLLSGIADIAQALDLNLLGNLPGEILANCAMLTAAQMASDSSFVYGGIADISSAAEIAAQSEMIYQAITSIASASSVSAEAYYLILAASALAVACQLGIVGVNVLGGVVEITSAAEMPSDAVLYLVKTLGYAGTLTAGDVLVIDCDKRTMKLNGVDSRANHTGVFLTLFSGTHGIKWDDDEGSRTIGLEVTHSPRYL